MKIAALILNYLVGLVFVVFGLNHFINFMPMPPMEGDPGIWAGILHKSNYLTVVKVMEVLFGAMLLLNFKRPLAWLLLLPIIVNIVLFEVFIAKQPGMGIALLLINFFMIYVYRDHYKGIVSEA